MTAKDASEYVENIGIILAEKVNALNRLIAVKEDHIKVLESRELRITPVSEYLGRSTVEQTPTIKQGKIIGHKFYPQKGKV